MGDPVALLGGRLQLCRVPETPPQLALDRGGAVLPLGGRLGQVTRVGYAQRLQVRAVEQGTQLAARRKVVSLRRIVQASMPARTGSGSSSTLRTAAGSRSSPGSPLSRPPTAHR